MIFRMRQPATVLAMMLAGVTLSAQALPELPPAQLQALTQSQPARAAQALVFLRANAPSLGLTVADDFALNHALTNPQGECVARFDQFNQGLRVQGSSVVVKVEPDGSCVLGGSSLSAAVSLPSTQPGLTPAQALAVLTAKLSPTVGYARPPSVEPIVFPTRLMGDLVLAKDEATGLLAMDPLRSAEAYTPATAHVRGYRIICAMKAATGPGVTLTVIMDADTGAILDRSFSGPTVTNPFAYATGYKSLNPRLGFAAAASRMPVTAADTSTTVVPGIPSSVLVPAIGTGLTTYSGSVAIPTTEGVVRTNSVVIYS